VRELCANCGLDVAIFRVEREGEVYCRDFCARQAALAEGEASAAGDRDGAVAALSDARARNVAKVRRGGGSVSLARPVR
jgi:hypothetical protein